MVVVYYLVVSMMAVVYYLVVYDSTIVEQLKSVVHYSHYRTTIRHTTTIDNCNCVLCGCIYDVTGVHYYASIMVVMYYIVVKGVRDETLYKYDAY